MIKFVKIAALLLSFHFSLQAQNAADEQAVFAVLQEGGNAFQAHDAARFANLYTENADFITPMGTILHGREQIRAAHTDLFKWLPKPEKITQENVERSVRFLTPDLAILTARSKETALTGGKSQDSEMSFSLLLKRVAGQWMIESFALIPVQKMPADKD